VRAVDSTGEWKETRYAFDGKVSRWGAAKDGLYTISENARQFYGEFDIEVAKKPMASEEGFKKHPQLVRTEQIAGLKTYVLKDQNGIETSYSLQTGKTILKAAIYSNDDSSLIDLVEALKIEFRELTGDEAQLPDLPVRFDIVEQKIQTLRAAGQVNHAERLQQAAYRLKANSK
jgi:hypothetical protein